MEKEKTEVAKKERPTNFNMTMDLTEKTSSIQVSENAKGQKSYSVKIYFDVTKEDGTMSVNELMETTYDDLHKRFQNR